LATDEGVKRGAGGASKRLTNACNGARKAKAP
jgi:hypothetical protein